jgi:uridine kinase
VSEARPFAVGIAGGSGSGKSALIRALLPLIGPERVATVSHEAYYVDRGELPAIQRAALGWDVPEAIDTELFLEHLETLRAGRPVRPRTGVDTPVEPRPIVLVEGVLLLHDPRVRALLDLAIFLDVPDATRVSRRSAGDLGDAGRTRRSGLAVYDSIASGAHGRYVEPTKAFADLVLLNVGRLDRVAEVAATVILDRVERRRARVVAA